jgi:hypothetical protein
MKKVTILLICFFTGVFLFGQVSGDFIVTNGVLEGYRGKGGNVTIPDNITGIDAGAFSGNKDIVVVNIPSGVARVGAGAFRSCERLTAVTLMPGVTAIDEYAFASCKSLAAIVIPNSVTEIGTGAFALCTGLYAVTMYRKTKVATDAFEGAPVHIMYLD